MIVTPTVHTLAGEPLTLRSPAEDDASALLAYLRALFAESWRNLNWPPSRFETTTVADEVKFISGLNADPDSLYVAVFSGSTIVAGAHVASEKTGFGAHVGTLGLSVLASHRRRGLGSLLLGRTLDAARDAGLTQVLLRVRTFNEDAWRLYERHGFRRVGVLHGVARLPDGDADEYMYQRSLS